MTTKQIKDIESVEYFIPQEYKSIQINEEDKEKYLNWSERGIGTYSRFEGAPKNGLEALILGKSRRGLHIGMWEEGVLEGSVPYFTLLGGTDGKRKWFNPMRLFKGSFYPKPIPRGVVDFMKKEMFKGIDAEAIEKCYQIVLNS